ncbi:hypothetical protein Bca101_010041 [Brassica carinata]
MVDNGDLKLKRPLEEDHDSSYEEGFKKATAKLELLDHLIKEAELRYEKKKLESQLRLAEAKVADLKALVIDWYKLGEPFMYD